MKVSAKYGKGEAMEVEYDFAGTLDEMCELFGDEVVLSNARANMVVGLQGVMRTAMASVSETKNEKNEVVQTGKTITVKDLRDTAKKWKPGVKKATKTPQQKILDQYQALDADTRAALLAEISSS